MVDEKTFKHDVFSSPADNTLSAVWKICMSVRKDFSLLEELKQRSDIVVTVITKIPPTACQDSKVAVEPL
jgi:hypothetical protein